MQSSKTETNDKILDVLHKISSQIDRNDMKEVNLFNEIQKNPSKTNSKDNLIKLLLRMISKTSNNNVKIKRLLSYLKSHVSLLQSISQNPDLASLFIIGENGSQSFNNLERSVLAEQAGRTRKFISDFNLEIPENQLANFDSYFFQPNDIPDKIKELSKIKKAVEKSNDLDETKQIFDEVCSLLETVILFNDLIITNFSLANERRDGCKKNNSHEKEIKCLHQKIKLLKNQIEQFDRKGEDNSKIDELKRQKKALKNELKNYKSKAFVDSKTSEMIQELHEKFTNIQKESSEMKQMLDKTNISYQKINEELEKQSLEKDKQNKALKKEKLLLIKQNQQLQEQVNNYQKDNLEKEDIISKINDKLTKTKSNSLQIQQNQTENENTIESLKTLLKRTEKKLNDSNNNYQDANIRCKRIEKDLEILKEENHELKQLLQQSSKDSEKVQKEKAVLIKQLNRNEKNHNNGKADSEVEKLKKKLKIAYAFIKKLQKQIEEYHSNQVTSENKSNNSSILISSDSFGKTYDDYYQFSSLSDSIASFQSETESLGPQLNDLDKAIMKLEETVIRSKNEYKK